ncbi:MAG: DNA mismatch repair endonuclease MutL [Oscillospiraceae bacterium]|nr:DNA mismatch repair endonuclease MutL [Oscillospiraceae bacterium]
MPKIHLLPKEISELIAAGEVIDRPASIVKELVENSIDAGATEITVEIKKGGIEYIRITDNGCGIPPEEAPTAFLRHATSKIHAEADLNTISTLGFRGEALASVCAVARVEMLTKTPDSPLGVQLRVEGGEQVLLEEAGCPDGTTIIVRDIFYNVPARLKFLKKDVSEGNAIASILNKIALSNPSISFSFIRDQTKQLQTPGDGELYSAIYAVYGKNFADGLMKVDYSLGDLSVSGYSSTPASARANRSMQHFFVNGRYVRSRTCSVALEEGYKNAVMAGKFPACVLNITLPFDFVDVNVHPTKTEVRFINERSVFDCLYFAVKTAITANEVTRTIPFPPEERVPSVFTADSGAVQESFRTPVVSREKESSFERRETAGRESSDGDFSSGAERIVASRGTDYRIHLEEPSLKESYQFLRPESFVRRAEDEMHPYPADIAADLSPAAVPLDRTIPAQEELQIRLLGELFETYIVAEINDFLAIVDKHAAHERILFEKLKAERRPLDHQVLLSPFTVILSTEECDVVLDNPKIMDELGFLVEGFGLTMVLVREIPAILDQNDASQLLAEIAINLKNHKQDPSPSQLDDLYHSIACKAAIKAHDKNSEPELLELVRRVYTDEAIRYCPHGRPVLQIWSRSKINKLFGR